MTGLGIITGYIGYAVLVWAIQAFGGTQDSFSSYIFPFAPNSPSSSGINVGAGASSGTPPAPADNAKRTKSTGITSAPPTGKATRLGKLYG